MGEKIFEKRWAMAIGAAGLAMLLAMLMMGCADTGAAGPDADHHSGGKFYGGITGGGR